MSCFKVSFFILVFAVGTGYFFGSEVHKYLSHEQLQLLESYMPKKIMTWMHKSVYVAPAQESKAKESRESKEAVTEKLFSKKELWDHYRGGKGSKGLCLAFLGKVYDVTVGEQHYGPGGGYAFFSGRDGTRGFVTGDFTDEGLTDNLDGLQTEQFLGFEEWTNFYASTYKYVGLLVGNFYDESGQPTDALRQVERQIALAKEGKKLQDDDRKKFPPCNSEFSAAKGARVWCSNRSGGIERDWVGLPRQYHPPGAAEFRCACIRDVGAPSGGKDTGANRGDLDNPYLREYSDCPSNAVSCITSPPKN